MSNTTGGGKAVQRAVIIGGGIAGPVTALALRKAGIEATLCEAYATTAEGIGGMLMVAPNGLDALRIVGVDVGAVGRPMPKMVMADGTGKVLAEFAGLPRLPPSQVLSRSDLYRVLHDRVAAEGLRVEHGKRLVDVVSTATGVTARFADGSTASGDVVIGADGIRSRVRTLIDPLAPGPEYVGFLGFGGYAAHDLVPARSDAMHFVFGKRAFMGYWSQPGGGTVWFSNLPHEQAMTMAEAREVPKTDWLGQLREVYADDVPGRDLVEKTSVDQFFAFGAGEILPRVPRWHRDRMVLVGDSALAPSSTSGQGASLAAESAIQLARCLRDLPDLPTAFAAYERLRRPRVEKIAADAAKRNNQKASGPVAKAIMGLLMPIAMKTFLNPEKMFGWTHGYRIDWDEVVKG